MYFQRRKTRGEKNSLFLGSGSEIMKEIIALCDGKCNPFRNFTAEEIILATDNFRKGEIAIERTSLYRGSFENRRVLVEMMKDEYNHPGRYRSESIRGLAIALQVSHHRNALKLLGICLEFDYPAAVYEDPGGLKPLFDILYGSDNSREPIPFLYGSDNSREPIPFPWSSRLRIAKDIANILVYLHSAFPTPLIYWDLNPRWVFIDQGGVTKLYNFSYSIALPPGKSEKELDGMMVTFGYLAPDSLSYDNIAPDSLPTNIVNTKCDVYSFGVVLLNLLTGYPPWDLRIRENNPDHTLVSYMKERIGEQGHLQNIVDQRMLIRGAELEEKEQMQAFWNLALECTKKRGIDRPEMIDVAKELKRIENMKCLEADSSATHIDNEEEMTV